MKPNKHVCEALMALVVMVVFAASGMGQQPTEYAKPDQGGYAIVTDLKENDGYFKAADEFKKSLHPEAQIVRFAADDWDGLAAQLKKLQPRYVAVVVRPETLDINFQGKFLRLCTQIDDDPFCDFSYGFITGGTAEEAVQFVQNIAKARKQGLPHKMLEVPKIGSGPKEPSAESVRMESTAMADGYGVDWPLVKVMFGETDKKNMTPEAVTAWMNENLADFKNNGVIMMGGHGMPKGIVGNLSGKDVRKLNLFPAVVFNYACMTGCVSRTYEWLEEEDVKKGDTANFKAKTVDASDSIALSVIASGASAYVASIEPRLAGPAMTGELAYALREGAALGDVRRREYDMLIMAYLGWGEKGLVVTPRADGAPKWAPKVRRDNLMMNGVSTVLFGDPAFRICEKSAPVLSAKLSRADGGLVLECETSPDAMQGIYSYLFDQYQHNAGGEDGMATNMRIYAAVELPKEVKGVTKVELIELLGADQRKIEGKYLSWAVEETNSLNTLHVKVNFSSDALRGTNGLKARFRVLTEAK